MKNRIAKKSIGNSEEKKERPCKYVPFVHCPQGRARQCTKKVRALAHMFIKENVE